MCGICGIVTLGDGPRVDPALLDTMRDTITHRGPDDAGSWLSPDGRVGLANRRLAIIDLSPAGHQPMSNEDGSVWIAYNGETYTYAQHFAPLKERGHKFRSQSDTEVIVHLYEEHGHDCLHHLRGMFAIALWDKRKRELFLARDRLGVKPLYYTFAGGQFIFGSEIKTILRHPAVKREIDLAAFYHFLTFLTPPAPDTLFKGIHKLPPGHRAALNADTGEFRVDEWWDVFDESDYDPRLTERDWAERLKAKLTESVKLRMVSDVPFGVFLSGGIDSTVNTALMAAQMDRPVQSFSIGYKDAPGYNEFEWARQAASHFGTDHREAQIGAQDFIEFLPKLIYHQDEPIADPVCVPIYFVSKLAKDSGTTVIQVGEGSDELFCGYRHWVDILRLHGGAWRAYSMMPRPVRQLALAGAGAALSGVRHEYVRRATEGEELFWGGAEAFGEARKNVLITESMRRAVGGLSSHDVIRKYRRRFDERSPHADYVTWMGYLDLRLRLPELLLMRVDKMTMATSVEARVPYLDHEFVGLAMSIPQRLKVGEAIEPKRLLKRAVRGLIPDAIIDRPKQGFRVPVVEWMAEALGAMGKQKLREFCARTDYLRWPAVEKLIDARDELAWYLLNFALWHEMWVEGREA
ncbi:MAG: asparagine synthase (glutamine-hydrolyzing) [Chloroflexi bacterium]|nr:asparagine synthase (glutamine-hydrolyzing) [Chloroflexota bacterium]